MGRNEIRLRRSSMSSGRIAQHRNYGELMARHEKEVRIKRIIRVFTYFLIIAFMIILFLMVRQVQEKKSPREPQKKVSGLVLETKATQAHHVV
jgi:large-conductance mechanosensitive channel